MLSQENKRREAYGGYRRFAAETGHLYSRVRPINSKPQVHRRLALVATDASDLRPEPESPGQEAGTRIDNHSGRVRSENEFPAAVYYIIILLSFENFI